MRHLLVLLWFLSINFQASNVLASVQEVDIKKINEQLKRKDVDLKTKINLHRQNADNPDVSQYWINYTPVEKVTTFLNSPDLNEKDFNYLLKGIELYGMGRYGTKEDIQKLQTFYRTVLDPSFKALETMDLRVPSKSKPPGSKKPMKALDKQIPKIFANRRHIEFRYRVFVVYQFTYNYSGEDLFEKIESFSLQQKLTALYKVLTIKTNNVGQELKEEFPQAERLLPFLISILKSWHSQVKVSQKHQNLLQEVYSYILKKVISSEIKRELKLTALRFFGTPIYEKAKQSFISDLTSSQFDDPNEIFYQYDEFMVKKNWRDSYSPGVLDYVFNSSDYTPLIADILEDIKSGKLTSLSQKQLRNLTIHLLSGDIVIENWDMAQKALNLYVSKYEIPKQILIRLFLGPTIPQKIKWLNDNVTLNTETQEIQLKARDGLPSQSLNEYLEKKVMIRAMVAGALDAIKTYSNEFWWLIKLGSLATAKKTKIKYNAYYNFFPSFDKLNSESKKAVDVESKLYGVAPTKFTKKIYKIVPSSYFKFVEDPFTGSVSLETFKALVNDLIKDLRTGTYDDKTVVCVSHSEKSKIGRKKPSELASIIKTRLKSGLYDKFIDSKGGLSDKLNKIMSYAQTLSDIPKEEGTLSPRNSLLFNLFQNMLSCSGGNIEAISTVYESVSGKFQVQTTLSLEDTIRLNLRKHHQNLLSRRTDIVGAVLYGVGPEFNEADTTWHSHYTSIIRSVIGKEIGIARPDSEPEFDQALWSGQLPNFVKELTKEGILNTFLEEYDLDEALTRVFELGQKDFEGHNIKGKDDLLNHMISSGFLIKAK